MSQHSAHSLSQQTMTGESNGVGHLLLQVMSAAVLV